MRAAISSLVVVLLATSGCGADTGDWRNRPPPPGTFVDGTGKTVSLDDYAGRYVWIDYAAEWCAACTPQTMAIKAVAADAPGDVAFVTIMTTEREGYGHPSTAATAARWASRFDLDPNHVWAGQVSYRYLPRNLLYSPRGDALFDEVGELDAGRIRAEIATHVGN